METAVLHPQDVLAPSQGHPNGRFSMASECASAAALATPVSVCHGISLDSVRRSSCREESRGVLSRKDSSAGLLPLPDHVPRSTHTSLQRSSAKFASVRGRGHSGGSPPISYRKIRFPVSTDEHAVPLQRRSVFDLDLVSRGRRRPACEERDVVPARIPLNSTRRCMASPSVSVPAEVLARPRIAPMAQTSFSPLYDTALPKWFEQPKVPLLSQATHLDSRLRKGGAKQFNDATCKSSSTLAKRYGGSRLLDRPASEKIQEQMKTSSFTGPSSREVAEKLPCASVLLHDESRRENDRQQELPACPALPMHTERNASLVREVLCARHEERNLKMLPHQLAGVARPSPLTWPQYAKWAESSVGRERSHTLGQFDWSAGKVESSIDSLTAGWSDEDGAPEGHVSRLPAVLEGKMESFRTKDVASNWHFRTQDVLERVNLVSDTTNWLSMIDEKWAGPSFFNSPPPSALPVPTFTSKLLRTTSTSPEPMNTADCEASLSTDAPVSDAKRTWDVAFATKDLRRLLHLDHASCDG